MTFQFHKGTIKTFHSRWTHPLDNRFQFHKGTIKTLAGSHCSSRTAKFQFHKGTIKTDTERLGCVVASNFNSIKVRLKHYCSNAKDEIIPFQFHKGTIKTFRGLFPLFPVSSFQFHKGTIKTYTLTEEGRKHLNFNSIKVRLKLIISIRDKSLSTISIP